MLKIVLVASFVACAAAIVCLPEQCANMQCTQLTAENCQGTIKANGGFCGCCDACITELAEGDTCMSFMMFGVPATTQCAAGLDCDSATSKCVAANMTPDKRDTGLCAQKLASYQLTMNQQPMLGMEKPQCDTNGDYEGMQVKGSQAYCVTKDGKPIDSYMVNRWEAGDMNCQCARDLQAYMDSGLIGKMFYCEANGNYPKSTRALAPCAQRHAEYMMTMQQKPMLLGLEEPHCDMDGNYNGMQYSGSQAFCVTKNGTAISGYMVNRWETGTDMNCQCARDQMAYQVTGMLGKMFHCEANGNYASMGCTGSVCYCQDKYGKQVGTTTVNIGLMGSLNC